LGSERPVFGVEQPSLPGVPLGAEPGDVVILSHDLFNGSWAG